MIVVSDTSPVTNLIRIDRLDILQQVYGQIVIPKIVYLELCELPFQKNIIDSQTWITIQSAANIEQVAALEEDLDAGEAEAIVLAIELQADYLIIDELKGRTIAENLNLKIVGLLGTLILAKKKGVIAAIKPITEQLILLGFRIQPQFYVQLLALVNE